MGTGALLVPMLPLMLLDVVFLVPMNLGALVSRTDAAVDDTWVGAVDVIAFSPSVVTAVDLVVVGISVAWVLFCIF